MQYKFSESVRETLVNAGWKENRCVDISEIELKFQDLGIEIFPVAKEFLTEFNWLELEFPNKAPYLLDALEGGDWLEEDYDEVQSYGYLDKILGKRLCPIGTLHDTYVFISEDEEIIYLWPWDSFSLFKNFEAALENYITPSLHLGTYSDLTPEQIPPGYI